MKILTVVGARPQFIKAASVSKALEAHGGFTEVMVHTGQHFDADMSDVFFSELGIKNPDHRLDIHSGSLPSMAARMIQELEPVMAGERPDMVMVYGDTVSTLAGCLTAVHLGIPVTHVEAGLREFDLRIPEEIHKRAVDATASLLAAPTPRALRQLVLEGRGADSILIGDVMSDTALMVRAWLTPERISGILGRHGLKEKGYILATGHRARLKASENLLTQWLESLGALPLPVCLVLHPATRKALETHSLISRLKHPNIMVLPPQGYSDMLALLEGSQLTATDSGGLIKESYLFGKPCIVTDTQTEWLEAVEDGHAIVADVGKSTVLAACEHLLSTPLGPSSVSYGDGLASKRLVDHLAAWQHAMPDSPSTSDDVYLLENETMSIYRLQAQGYRAHGFDANTRSFHFKICKPSHRRTHAKLSFGFAGQNAFAIQVLTALCRHGLTPSFVITPKTAGDANPLIDMTRSKGIPLHVIENIAEMTLQLSNLDVCLVASWPAKIPPNVYSRPKHGMINLHPSLLPALRGSSPVAWAIRRGLSNTGVTAHAIDEHFDSGDILGSRNCAVLETDTAGSLKERLGVLAGELAIEVLTKLSIGKPAAMPQDPARVTKAPHRDYIPRNLDWSMGGREISRHIRSLSPFPCCTISVLGQAFHLIEALFEPLVHCNNTGLILGAVDQTLWIAVNDGILKIRVREPIHIPTRAIGTRVNS